MGRARGRTSIGAWSSASFGPDLLVELRAGKLGLGLEGRYDVARVGVGSAADASVQRVTGSFLPCAHFGWLVTCGIAALGETWARGNVAAPETESAPYLALGGRVGVDVTLLPKLHLLGTVDVVGVTTPTVIGINLARTESGPVEGSGGIALLVPIL